MILSDNLIDLFMILSKLGSKSVILIFLWPIKCLIGGFMTTTSTFFIYIFKKSQLLNSTLLSTSYTFKLFNKNSTFFLLWSFAMTLEIELISANLIVIPPIPANPSNIFLAPLHLPAIYYDAC